MNYSYFAKEDKNYKVMKDVDRVMNDVGKGSVQRLHSCSWRKRSTHKEYFVHSRERERCDATMSLSSM